MAPSLLLVAGDYEALLSGPRVVPRAEAFEVALGADQVLPVVVEAGTPCEFRVTPAVGATSVQMEVRGADGWSWRQSLQAERGAAVFVARFGLPPGCYELWADSAGFGTGTRSFVVPRRPKTLSVGLLLR